MIEDKLYTLQELADLTRLTNRTLRNYLANGTLTGHKIGGQWRFNKDEVNALFKNCTFFSDRKSKAESMVQDFLAEKLSFTCNQSACVVVDMVKTNKEERNELFKALEQIPKDENLKEKVSFIGDDGHVRINIVGSLRYIKQVLNLIGEN